MTVTEIVRLGFEVRVYVQDAHGLTSWVQLTHEEAQLLGPFVGESVSISTRAGLGANHRVG